MKRFLIILLLVLSLGGMVPNTASAEESGDAQVRLERKEAQEKIRLIFDKYVDPNYCIEDPYYSFSNQKAKRAELHVVAEGIIKGSKTQYDKIKAILSASMEFPSGITKIGRFAFAYSDGLVDITIPDSVTVIEHGAFLFCDSLTSVKMSDDLMEIEDLVFKFCYNLTDITWKSNTYTSADAFMAAFDSAKK